MVAPSSYHNTGNMLLHIAPWEPVDKVMVAAPKFGIRVYSNRRISTFFPILKQLILLVKHDAWEFLLARG